MEWIKIFASGSDARKRLQENKPQLLIIHDKRISLVMRKERFFAVADSCPHNGQSLSKGTVNFRGEIVCPLHDYRFELTTGRESALRCRDLQTYATKEDETGFYIAL